MKLSDFDFELPEALIATRPARPRSSARLLLAKGDQIFAIPTLVRKIPLPMRKIIGDLSNKEKVLVGLDIKTIK